MLRSERPIRRIVLFAAPLVLVGFAAGVVYGPHRLPPGQPRQNGPAVRSEPARWVSPPEPSQEDEPSAQRLIALPPESPPGEAGIGTVSPPPDNSIAGSTKRDDTLRDIQSETFRRVIELYRKGDVAGG